MKLIGLAGQARHGKSTVAAMLEENLPAYHLRFADPLKEVAQTLLLATPDMVEGIGYDREQVMDEWGISVRYFLQTMGTEVMREMFREDFWIQHARLRVGDLFAGPRVIDGEPAKAVVFSDVRFPNEAQYIRERGELWHIKRPDAPTLSGKASKHASEQVLSVEAKDFVIVNDGSLVDLEDKVMEAWRLSISTNFQQPS